MSVKRSKNHSRLHFCSEYEQENSAPRAVEEIEAIGVTSVSETAVEPHGKNKQKAVQKEAKK